MKLISICSPEGSHSFSNKWANLLFLLSISPALSTTQSALQHRSAFTHSTTHSCTGGRSWHTRRNTCILTQDTSTCRPQRPEIEPSILRSVDDLSDSGATAAHNNLFFSHLSFSFLTFPSTASSALYFLSAAPSWHSDSHPAVAQTPDTGSAASGPSHTHTHTHT